ncbi:hypothetical protein EVG20_g2150 [Dentipellis fragilis]|uniref:Altered inheritance of mitochondria protein 41 n=1 Tax=Dentipellis fragilis TaxID=205917 RepID=A0A4Y9ZAL8_9AGAM|nr:hypothetical protein EVG20_g2150 [Dentipellis fragilis]
MKNKDSFSSTTIRSVLAEVYAADKASKDGKVPSSNIFTLIKKAQKRRLDAATKFIEATRADLAEKEQKEADFLSTFLPPLLPEAEVVRILEEIISQQRAEGDQPKKTLSKVLPVFYAKVEKTAVDPVFVKDKILELVSN